MRVQLAGYKVKCMLAEPKGKRGRADSGGGSLDNAASWQVRTAHQTFGGGAPLVVLGHPRRACRTRMLHAMPYLFRMCRILPVQKRWWSCGAG